jgi:hypothetical protein
VCMWLPLASPVFASQVTMRDDPADCGTARR